MRKSVALVVLNFLHKILSQVNKDGEKEKVFSAKIKINWFTCVCAALVHCRALKLVKSLFFLRYWSLDIWPFQSAWGLWRNVASKNLGRPRVLSEPKECAQSRQNKFLACRRKFKSTLRAETPCILNMELGLRRRFFFKWVNESSQLLRWKVPKDKQ